MPRLNPPSTALVIFSILSGSALFAASTANPAAVTFAKDVAPILQQHCQECHRPGEAAPFSLLTYEQVRPWAKAIRQAVLTRKMPPWFASPHYGKFSNDRSLPEKDAGIIVAWVNGGAPQGDPKDMPPPRKFVEGWSIPKPDVVFELPKPFPIPATGTVEYQKIIVPSGFTEDKWVQFAEARPDQRAQVHHMIVFIREPGSHWLQGEKVGRVFRRAEAEGRRHRYQRAAQRFSGRLCAGPTSGEA